MTPRQKWGCRTPRTASRRKLKEGKIRLKLSPEMPLPHVCLHESDGSGNWKRGGAQDCGEEAVGSGGDGAASSSVMQGGGPGDGSSASQPAFGVWHARAACH